MVLLLVCMLFVSKLYEFIFPACFGKFVDLYIKTKEEAESKECPKGVTDLADSYIHSYIWNEAFIASFINLLPILLFSYKVNIMIEQWFILFYITVLVTVTIMYSIINLVKSKRVMHQVYHPNFYRTITVIITFLSFFRIYARHL